SHAARVREHVVERRGDAAGEEHVEHVFERPAASYLREVEERLRVPVAGNYFLACGQVGEEHAQKQKSDTKHYGPIRPAPKHFRAEVLAQKKHGEPQCTDDSVGREVFHWVKV